MECKKCKHCLFFTQYPEEIMYYINCGELTEEECFIRIEKAVKKGWGFCKNIFNWVKADSDPCEDFIERNE